MGKMKFKKSNIKSADNLLKPEPIAADPNLVASDFEGLVSFEEITDYKISKFNDKSQNSFSKKDSKKKKKKVKRLQPDNEEKTTKNAKGVNSTSAFKVKALTSEGDSKKKKKKKPSKDSSNKILKNQSAVLNQQKETMDEVDEEVSEVVSGSNHQDNMETWAGMGISEPLLQALKLKKFTSPTQVQALSIPPAILGRRDILGAAETGSGKTLAFGLPILQGILIQKELAEKSESTNVENLNENSETEEEESNEGNAPENEENTASSDDETENDDEDYELVEDDFDEEPSNFDDGSDENAEDMGCVKVVHNAVFNLKNATKKYKQKPLYALILTPTRELAVQIRKHLMDAAAMTDIKIALVVGGLSSQKQERLLNYGPEIVVGTPGRLWELIQQRHPHFENIQNIRFLAVDETDRMLEKGHFEELTQLLTLLNDDVPGGVRRQNFLFSATLSLVHAPPSYIKRMKKKGNTAQLTPEAKLQNIVKQMGLQNPKIVDITQPNCVPETLKEARIICSTEEKDFYLYYFLKLHPGRTLVFCNSIGCVQRLHSLFTLLQCSPYPLHSNLQQRQRLKNLERFTQNAKSILVATDVAARGLDVPNVQHVIHYQVPRTAESYIHRSGRTARASEDGLTVLLMDGSEVRTYTKIFSTLKRDPILPDFPIENKYLMKVKDRVKLARELDVVELRSKRLSSEESWVKKAVTEMDLELSDDELPIRSSKGKVDNAKKRATAIRKRLSILVQQPLFDPVQQLSRKAFITSGINSDGSYAGVKGPKPSAVKALEAALEERKEQKKKRKLERSKKKLSAPGKANGAVAKMETGSDESPGTANNEGSFGDGDGEGEAVDYPDFSKEKKRKKK